MPNFDELIADTNAAIAAVAKIQELLKILEENYDNPTRVKILVQISYGWLDTEIENLTSSNEEMRRRLEASRKRCKASQTRN